MRRRVTPYLSHYSTAWPFDDNGALPTGLIVVEKPRHCSALSRTVQEEMDTPGIQIPMMSEASLELA